MTPLHHRKKTLPPLYKSWPPLSQCHHLHIAFTLIKVLSHMLLMQHGRHHGICLSFLFFINLLPHCDLRSEKVFPPLSNSRYLTHKKNNIKPDVRVCLDSTFHRSVQYVFNSLNNLCWHKGPKEGQRVLLEGPLWVKCVRTTCLLQNY